MEMLVDWQEFTTTWGFNYAFWAGLALTATLAYWTYTTLPRSRLAYHMRHSTVIDAASPDFSSSITIAYEGSPIPRATLSQVFVWNDGNQTLKRQDIAPKSPLTLFVPAGQRILRVSLEATDQDAMDVFIEPGDEAAVNVTFEYMAPHQGFICSVLHTGSQANLKFDGVVVSAGSPRYAPLPHEYLSNGWFASMIIGGAALPIMLLQLIRDYVTDAGVLYFFLAVVATLGVAIGWSFGMLELASRHGHAKIKFGKPLT